MSIQHNQRKIERAKEIWTEEGLTRKKSQSSARSQLTSE